jgi:hypothetical protein
MTRPKDPRIREGSRGDHFIEPDVALLEVRDGLVTSFLVIQDISAFVDVYRG